MKLIKYYNNLKEKFEKYDNIIDYESIVLDEFYSDDVFDELIECYTQFIDVFSEYCDYIIENTKNEKLINQSMKFYFMINKDYFKSNSDEDDIENIERIIYQFEPHNEILNYEFNIKDEKIIICNVCEGEGDIPNCIQCGKSKL